MQFSAPLKSNSKKIMLLGSGELGKEVAIEAQRLGLEVVAVDRYQNAPAHHVAPVLMLLICKTRQHF